MHRFTSLQYPGPFLCVLTVEPVFLISRSSLFQVGYNSGLPTTDWVDSEPRFILFDRFVDTNRSTLSDGSASGHTSLAIGQHWRHTLAASPLRLSTLLLISLTYMRRQYCRYDNSYANCSICALGTLSCSASSGTRVHSIDA